MKLNFGSKMLIRLIVNMRALDNEIDRMVYKLYGLTEDEIKIVEGKSEP